MESEKLVCTSILLKHHYLRCCSPTPSKECCKMINTLFSEISEVEFSSGDLSIKNQELHAMKLACLVFLASLVVIAMTKLLETQPRKSTAHLESTMKSGRCQIWINIFCLSAPKISLADLHWVRYLYQIAIEWDLICLQRVPTTSRCKNGDSLELPT